MRKLSGAKIIELIDIEDIEDLIDSLNQKDHKIQKDERLNLLGAVEIVKEERSYLNIDKYELEESTVCYFIDHDVYVQIIIGQRVLFRELKKISEQVH